MNHKRAIVIISTVGAGILGAITLKKIMKPREISRTETFGDDLSDDCEDDLEDCIEDECEDDCDLCEYAEDLKEIAYIYREGYIVEIKKQLRMGKQQLSLMKNMVEGYEKEAANCNFNLNT